MCYRLLHKIILYSSKVRSPDRFSVCCKFYCGVTLDIEGKTTWQLRCYPIVTLEFFLEKEVIHFFSRKKTIILVRETIWDNHTKYVFWFRLQTCLVCIFGRNPCNIHAPFYPQFFFLNKSGRSSSAKKSGKLAAYLHKLILFIEDTCIS